VAREGLSITVSVTGRKGETQNIGCQRQRIKIKSRSSPSQAAVTERGKGIGQKIKAPGARQTNLGLSFREKVLVGGVSFSWCFLGIGESVKKKQG